MTTSDENLNNQKLKLENDNQEEEKKEVNIQETEKNELNNQSPESESSSSCFKNPKILIAIIVAAVVIIVLVVVLAVVLTKSDDSSSFEDIGDERWNEAYKKAKKFLEPFSYEEKYLLLYGDYNVSKTCVGGISPNSKRGFPGICLQDGPAGVRPSDYTTT